MVLNGQQVTKGINPAEHDGGDNWGAVRASPVGGLCLRLMSEALAGIERGRGYAAFKGKQALIPETDEKISPPSREHGFPTELPRAWGVGGSGDCPRWNVAKSECKEGIVYVFFLLTTDFCLAGGTYFQSR